METNMANDNAGPMNIHQRKIRTLAQATPNPMAYKFLVSEDVKIGGKISFTDVAECMHVPLARRILELPYVVGVHMFENFVTVSQDGSVPWEDVTDEIEAIIKEEIPEHIPNFPTPEDMRRSSLDPALRRIEEILDESIRPALQMDGGDIEVISLEDNVLKINFEGACGSCPSSRAGTLHAITEELKAKFHPAIIIEPVNQEFFL